MNMFTNYQDLEQQYIPNNLACSFPVGKSYTKLDPIKTSKPYEEYNIKGDLVGYSWRYGETLHLEFNIDGEVVVESDALTFNKSGECPNSKTSGRVSQKAYNVVDLKCWVCTSANTSDNVYFWEEIPFEHDLPGSTESVYVSASDYLRDKEVEFQLFNFRQEPIYKQYFSGTSKIIVNIDKNLSEALKKGIYYCSLTVVSDKIRTPVFSSSDCVLLVK